MDWLGFEDKDGVGYPPAGIRSTDEILEIARWILDKADFMYDTGSLTSTGHGAMPLIVESHHQQALDNHLAESIKTNVLKYGYRYSDNLILGRADYQLLSLYPLLKKAGIPFRHINKKVTHDWYVTLLLTPLQVIVDWRNESLWAKYMNEFEATVVKDGLSWESHKEWSTENIIKEITAEDTLEDALSALAASPAYQRCIDPLLAISHCQNEPRKCLEIIYDFTRPYIERMYPENKLDKIHEHYDHMLELSDVCSNVGQFIEVYEDDCNKQASWQPDGDRVILSTIPSAKNIQASNCFILNVNPNQWPEQPASKYFTAEELRRMLFIGMTRTTEHLTMYRYVSKMDVKLGFLKAYFLNDLPLSLADVETI